MAHSRIRFDTAPFTRSHGTTPRGRGSWAFQLEGQPVVFSPSMTFADAKRWMTAKAREQIAAAGATDIRNAWVSVLP